MLVPAASAAAWQRTTRHPMLLFVVTQGCGLINPVLIGLLFVTRISHRSQAMQWLLICAYMPPQQQRALQCWHPAGSLGLNLGLSGRCCSAARP